MAAAPAPALLPDHNAANRMVSQASLQAQAQNAAYRGYPMMAGYPHPMYGAGPVPYLFPYGCWAFSSFIFFADAEHRMEPGQQMMLQQMMHAAGPAGQRATMMSGFVHPAMYSAMAPAPNVMASGPATQMPPPRMQPAAPSAAVPAGKRPRVQH